MAAAGGRCAGATRISRAAGTGLGRRGDHGELEARASASAGRAANCLTLAEHELLELVAALFANVFKNRHEAFSPRRAQRKETTKAKLLSLVSPPQRPLRLSIQSPEVPTNSSSCLGAGFGAAGAI